MTADIISAIDAATGCQQCGNPLGSSPSSDFCSEFCQGSWHEKRVGIEPVAAEPRVLPSYLALHPMDRPEPSEPHPSWRDFSAALRALYRGV